MSPCTATSCSSITNPASERQRSDSTRSALASWKLASQLDICVKTAGGPDNANISHRHAGGANCVFMDGHAKWYTYNAIVWERSPEKELWGHFSSPEAE